MSSENALLPRVWELERSLATAVRVNESLRQQLAAAQEEITVDEQRVADLMGDVNRLGQQLDDHLKREVMLRSAIGAWDRAEPDELQAAECGLLKALAATEPK